MRPHDALGLARLSGEILGYLRVHPPAADTVAGIVERRHTLPILANVLLTKKDSEITFLASDVELLQGILGDDGADE